MQVGEDQRDRDRGYKASSTMTAGSPMWLQLMKSQDHELSCSWVFNQLGYPGVQESVSKINCSLSKEKEYVELNIRL